MDGLSPAAWKFLQQMMPALIGLLGVLVGAFLTLFREWRAESRRARKDAALLAAIVGGELDKFVNGCGNVAQDQGEDDEHGYTNPSVGTPTFDPAQLQVEWRSIPHSIMFDIVDLPYQIRTANGVIGNISHYADSPPDYCLTFQERQYQFSLLGLHAMSIVDKLRRHTGLEPRRNNERWDPSALFNSKVAEYKVHREREKAAQEWPITQPPATTVHP